MAVLLRVEQRGPLYVRVDVTSHLVSLGLSYWIGKTFGLDGLKLSYSGSKMSLKERKMEEMKDGKLWGKSCHVWFGGVRSQSLKFFFIVYVLPCCLVLFK